VIPAVVNRDTDLHEFAGGPIVIPSAPHQLTGAVAPQVLGHEFSALVLETGSDVTSVQAGDRVSVMPLIYCGRCYYCRRGLNHLCVSLVCTGLSWHGGGIAEQVVVPAYQVEKLPAEVTEVQGALVEPTAVAAYGIDRTGMVPGDTVLITGAGPIGALSALYAHASGAAHVIVSEPDSARRKLVDELGVATSLDPTAVDVAEAVRELTDGIGADVAAQCSGSEGGLQNALASVRSRGTATQVGLHVRPASIDPMDLANRDITLTGTWCYPVQDWPRIIALVASGHLHVIMGTVGPTLVREVARAAAEHGVEVVDAPVSGSVSLADAAQITTMVGSTDEQFAQVSPVLAAMTKMQYHTGPVGSGSTAKLAVNAVLAALNQGIAEGMLLAEAGGLDGKVFYEVLRTSAAGAPYVGYKSDAFLTPAETAVSAPVSLIHKDVRLALDLAGEQRLTLPGAEAVVSVLDEATDAGLGEADMAQVLAALRLLNNSR
jgi:(R,R)-butanediol dehydrogenase/meso-butanediol dehydrogenase/diacetyl reductase